MSQDKSDAGFCAPPAPVASAPGGQEGLQAEGGGQEGAVVEGPPAPQDSAARDLDAAHVPAPPAPGLHEILIEEETGQPPDNAAAAASAAAPPARPKVVELPMPARGHAEDQLEVPAGLHGHQILAGLLETPRAFHGLVIVAGLLDYARLEKDHAPEEIRAAMAAVERFILDTLRGREFACRIAEDEFLIICPGLTGAEARQRVQAVSEQLWDYQLRALRKVTVAFSWGAVESHGRSLAEAVEQAREEMLDTRENRRVLTSGGALFERWAAGR